MLKKIKELSKEELDNICKEKMYCNECPLEIGTGPDTICIKEVIKRLKDFNRRMEVEIEVKHAKQENE